MNSLDDALNLHRRMVENLRAMRATIHQLITHPESDTINDGVLLERLASYRAVVCSTIETTKKLHQLATKKGRPFTARALNQLLVDLHKGTF